MVVVWSLMIGGGLGCLISAMGFSCLTVPGSLILIGATLMIWGIIGRIEWSIQKNKN